jgi:PII-like signaling protein
MTGYQVTFYTTLGRQVQGTHVKDWLIGVARELGIPGATVFAGLEGYGHDRRFHSAHFFEMADEPIMVVMVMSAAHKDLLIARLNEVQADIFHVIQAVEMGERPPHPKR